MSSDNNSQSDGDEKVPINRKEQPFSCVKIAALSWCILLLSRRYLPDKLEVVSEALDSEL